MVSRETEMMSEREKHRRRKQDKMEELVRRRRRESSFSSLGRQSSIYSLTLDEFQHALCENGKNFGSMNMDEFLVSGNMNIDEQNAEENQQQSPSAALHIPFHRVITKPGIAKQPSLPRQGSLTLPAPLCRKTVEEVAVVGGDNSNGRSTSSSNGQNNANNGGGESAARQPTFGEMTLEDFLVKAGVCYTGIYQQQQLYGVFPGGGDPSFPVGVGSDPSGYGKRAGGGGYQQAPPVQSGMGMVGPLSPVSSDGLGHGQVDNIGGQYGVDMGGLRGRKRVVDGPVEKVVERRQRRMIKNRESAARSRARKQAYTVELEAELNQLKEENAQLKHALGELERKRKQQYFESLKTRAQPKVPKVSGRLRTLMRNPSCPL
ncbi:LOW QUALITY PROTEIN: hypothetical protein HID58_094608 [Brassica napus]|uniref:BZIP domain-containing protein n=1 Tax=Brassica napus TaxID=3708 RepID=A0ABQ7X6P5_BRANA|nr:LOW QUALITY PROTEIN: hypothetical protein HID58_094608 [Brassica napus]